MYVSLLTYNDYFLKVGNDREINKRCQSEFKLEIKPRNNNIILYIYMFINISKKFSVDIVVKLIKIIILYQDLGCT